MDRRRISKSLNASWVLLDQLRGLSYLLDIVIFRETPEADNSHAQVVHRHLHQYQVDILGKVMMLSRLSLVQHEKL